MQVCVTFDYDDRPFDFYDSYEQAHFAMMRDKNCKMIMTLEFPDDERQTIDKYILAKNRLVFLTQTALRKEN